MYKTGTFTLFELRRLWADDDLTNAQIAEAIGYSARGLSGLARKLGLPPRRIGPKGRIDPVLLAALWTAGVGKREIAARFGVDRTTLCHTAQKIGLPRRKLGYLPVMTYDQFLQQQLAARMAREASETAAAMLQHGMVDHPNVARRLMRRAA